MKYLSRFGFYIHKLILVGTNVENATLDLTKGLNIVSGPSDTGKTYIFECINYILGSSSEPKKIAEAKGYTACLLEIVMYDGEIFTIKREFGKGTVEVFKAPFDIHEQTVPKSLNFKHDKDNTENLSVFLLEHCGFKHPQNVLKSKKKSNIRTLSFRDLPIYIMVSEEKIIKSESPILSGQYTAVTAEKSIFKLIATGEDDSDISVTKNDMENSFKKLEGQIELIERFIVQEEKQLLSLSPVDISLETRLKENLEEIKVQLSIINTEIEERTIERRNIWNLIENDKSRKIALDELIKRFNLLKKQYLSDLERLNFIREGNHYFGQLKPTFCPLCNKEIQHDSCEVEKSGLHNNNNASLIEAIEAEIEKVNNHLIDLISTIEENELEYQELISRIHENEKLISNINDMIEKTLTVKETNLKAILNSYENERDGLVKYKLTIDKIKDLNIEKTLIQKKLEKQPQNKTKGEISVNGTILSAYKDVCTYIEETLKSWKFSEETVVTFKDGLFFVDSKPTKDYGKGYRAIIYSAFVISLMKYCKDKYLPHPGFVVLDSPLTTYKGKKTKENVNDDIQNAFFEDIAKLEDNMQIIILENKEPEKEIKEIINYIEFTKDESEGRYGFFHKH